MFRTGKVVVVLILTLLVAACGAKKNDDHKNDDHKNDASQGSENYVETASFTDLKGDSVAISDFKGKVVMIDFWETWCKPCIASFSALDKLQQEYAQDFVVLAVTPGFTDTKEDAQTFAEDHNYAFKYLMDTNNLHEKLNVQSIPFKVYVDSKGNFIKSSMGSYGPDEDYQKVKQIIEEHKSSGGSAHKAGAGER